MKTQYYVLSLAAAALLVAAVPAAFADGCSMTCKEPCDSYAGALKQAQAAGKPLVLDFYTEW